MKKIILTKTIFVFLAFGCFVFSQTACDRLGEIKEFQIYSGNESLPPPRQRVLIVGGKIAPEKISIDYSYREGENKKIVRRFELVGEERERCLRTVKNTSLSNPKISYGGGAFDITLTDATGKNEMGVPSNAKEWQQLADEIEKKAVAQENTELK